MLSSAIKKGLNKRQYMLTRELGLRFGPKYHSNKYCQLRREKNSHEQQKAVTATTKADYARLDQHMGA